MKVQDLEQFKIIKIEIEQLQETKKEIEERKDSIKSQIITDMPKGGGTAKTMEDIVSDIENIIVRIAEKSLKLADVLLDIEKAIEVLEPLERALIRYRYICDMPFYQIAKKLNYSERQVYRMHNKIIEALK